MNLELGMYASRLSNNNIEKIKEIFQGAEEVTIRDIDKKSTGRGHYKISVSVAFENADKLFKVSTNDMPSIDNWNDEDGNITEDTIMWVLSELEDFIQEYIYDL